MASDWRYSVTLVDDKALKTTLNFEVNISDISIVAEFTTAETIMGTLKTALEAVTDANVYRESLSYLVGGSTTLPSNGSDVTDEAAVVCFLSAAGEVPKYHTLRIPAPIAAMFESDLVTVDETNAALIAYVDEIGTNWDVSDGEQIDTSNDNGISHGFWRSRAKSSQ